MISYKHKFIFVHINKTGGTSIEKVFVDDADSKDVRFKHKDITFYKIRFPDVYDHFFKFAFVRNPWDWLVSRYVWSKEKQGLINMSFGDMLQHIAEGRTVNPDAGWLNGAMRPQSDRLLIDGKVAVDFIGRFESLQTDFDHVCKQIGIAPVELPHVFGTQRSHYAEYYDDSARRLVQSLYAADIRAFDYAFDETGDA